MTDIPPPSKAVLDCAEALARELFGQRVRAIQFVPRGVMNHKFKVTLRDDAAYGFRVYPQTREHVVEYEPDLVRRCEAAGLPVSKVMIDSRSGPEVGYRYMVYHWIQGVPMDERLPFLDGNRLTQLAQGLLSFLEGFARLTVTGYGELESATKAQCRTWREFLETTLSASLPGQSSSSWDRDTTRILRAVVELAASAAPAQKPVLAWGDISPENILLDTQDRIAGILDFEGTLAADFSLTLGYCYARFLNEPFFETLWNAWPKSGDQQVGRAIQVHAVLRALRLARFTGFPMPTGHPRKPVSQILPGFQEALNTLRKRPR